MSRNAGNPIIQASIAMSLGTRATALVLIVATSMALAVAAATPTQVVAPCDGPFPLTLPCAATVELTGCRWVDADVALRLPACWLRGPPPGAAAASSWRLSVRNVSLHGAASNFTVTTPENASLTTLSDVDIVVSDSHLLGHSTGVVSTSSQVTQLSSVHVSFSDTVVSAANAALVFAGPNVTNARDVRLELSNVTATVAMGAPAASILMGAPAVVPPGGGAIAGVINVTTPSSFVVTDAAAVPPPAAPCGTAPLLAFFWCDCGPHAASSPPQWPSTAVSYVVGTTVRAASGSVNNAQRRVSLWAGAVTQRVPATGDALSCADVFGTLPRWGWPVAAASHAALPAVNVSVALGAHTALSGCDAADQPWPARDIFFVCQEQPGGCALALSHTRVPAAVGLRSLAALSPDKLPLAVAAFDVNVTATREARDQRSKHERIRDCRQLSSQQRRCRHGQRILSGRKVRHDRHRLRCGGPRRHHRCRSWRVPSRKPARACRTTA